MNWRSPGPLEQGQGRVEHGGRTWHSRISARPSTASWVASTCGRSLLDEGELLTELSDNSSMWVYFNVPEAEYLAYQKNALAGNGTRVALRMANGGCSISRARSRPSSRTSITARATSPFAPPSPIPRMLRHGETGNILMDSRLNDVLIIPQKATFEVLDHRYVYVIGADSVLRITASKWVPSSKAHLHRGEGSFQDDRILLEGLRKVEDGQKVDYTPMVPDSVMRHLELRGMIRIEHERPCSGTSSGVRYSPSSSRY